MALARRPTTLTLPNTKMMEQFGAKSTQVCQEQTLNTQLRLTNVLTRRLNNLLAPFNRHTLKPTPQHHYIKPLKCGFISSLPTSSFSSSSSTNSLSSQSREEQIQTFLLRLNLALKTGAGSTSPDEETSPLWSNHTLHLSSTLLDVLDDTRIIETLQQFRTLRAVAIEASDRYGETNIYPLHMHSVNVISDLIRNNPSLDAVVLKQIDLSDKTRPLCEALKSLTSLSKLSLVNNNMTTSDWANLGSFISSTTSLVDLNISKNDTCAVERNSFESFAAAIQTSRTIARLAVSHSKLAAENARSIGEAISLNASLREVEISSCFASSAISKQFLSRLKQNRSIKAANLSKNSINVDGVRELTHMLLSDAYALEELDLSNNPLGDDGAMLVAESLRRNSKLKRLNLSDCAITPFGAEAIYSVLRTHPAIKNVELSPLVFLSSTSSIPSSPPSLSSPAAAASSSRDPSPGVLIIGGGIVGLGAAVKLLEAGYRNVTIVSEKFTPHTTSDSAGASIRPGGDYPPPDADRIVKWGKQTSDYLAKVRHQHGAKGTGVTLCSGYEFWQEDPGVNYWSPMVFGLRHVPKSEMESIGFVAPFGTFYTTYHVDVPVYQQFLIDQIKRLGGKLVRSRIESFNQLRAAVYEYNMAHESNDPSASLNKLEQGDRVIPLTPEVRHVLRSNRHAFVVNCSGLASQRLVPDYQVQPSKGVIVLVKCPGLTHFYTNLDRVSYIIPRQHDVVIGGSMLIGDDTPGVPDGYVEAIIKDAAMIIPELKSATILRSWFDYRPMRPTVRVELVRGEEPPSTFPTPIDSANFPQLDRLENHLTADVCRQIEVTEHRRLANRSENELFWDSPAAPKVPIIHSYGHGGSGITLHIGCGMEVVELAQTISPSSKL